ncbi:MAG: polysaccharide biosynthesis tyrosine autokinase [Bacteroidales bacterium]|nr:polysaccharide biosynthesis tyrosine autokinase [Bacteroidales bacterium]MBN2763882.1 polysaccharide biosynthesis tyrosine autokinase [Bacteroidales bacterium]
MKNTNENFTSTVDYKRVFNRLYSFKKTYIVIAIIFLAGAFLINRYSPKIYRNSTLVFITNTNQNSLLGGASQNLFQGMGFMANKPIIDNEIEIIKSFSLVKEVINELNLKTTYISCRNNSLAELFYNTPLTRKTELYDDSPIKVNIDPSMPQAVYLVFNIVFLNDNEYQLEAHGEEIDIYNYIDDQVISRENIFFKNRFRFSDEVKTRYFNFRIQKTENFDKAFTDNNKLVFYFNNTNYLTLEYISNLKVEQTSQNSTLINISLKGINAKRITDFLNGLTSVYMDRSLEKKSKMALGTINFIDSQIADVADSLSTAESRLKVFRSSHSVMDLGFQGQQTFETLTQLETEKANLNAQRRYYQYLRDNLSNESIADLASPSSMNVVDPILTNLVTQLITLSSEKASLMRDGSNQQNLYLNNINLQIENLRKTLKDNVTNTLNTLNMSVNEINYRISKLSSQISQMPKTELQLKGIERKFKINDEIYTFLLQKRSEAQIQRASSLPDYEIVDPAQVAIVSKIAPMGTLNYAIALLLALLLPSLAVFAYDFLNNRIMEADELESLADLPVLGKIFHSYRRAKIVAHEHPNSSVTECFRAVRTNFQFFSEGGRKQVLLLTSSTSGEGKTFCSMNLAAIFALNGHRTVLLEFDLRRPKIHQEFGSSNMIGISSYLIDKAVIEDIIIPTHIENLDLISAGPAAPNPAELINSERASEFIDKLKEMYDYIIIDSAPAGILTETYLLMKYADLNILIVRLNKTIRDTFKTTLKNLEANKFTNLSILINDIDISREAFKYGYDKKYYTDDHRNGLLTRIFGRKE